MAARFCFLLRPAGRRLGLLLVVALGACTTTSDTPRDPGKESAAQAAASSQSLQPTAVGADPGWKLEPLPAPASYSSVSPQLTVEGERAILSWLDIDGGRAALRFAERTKSGWSEVRTVIAGDDLVVNASDVPSVRALADGTLAAHWLQEDGSDPEAYKLPLSWSKDGGRTWTPPVYPHHDGRQVQHGFASLFQAPGAGLGLVWLDGRTMSSDAPQGAMGLWAAVYGSDGKQLSETTVDPRVCDCCPISAAATADGVIVAYRDRSAEEVRDIYLTRFEQGRWSMPALVHNDGWKIEGCPVNGPAVSARGRDVAVSWFTAAGDEGRSFVAFSRDGGGTFGPAIRVDDEGSLGEVDVELLSDGSAAVSWIEFADTSQSKLRRIEQNGARSPALVIAGMSRGRSSRLVQAGPELLLAWPETTETGSAIIRTARVGLTKAN